MKSRVRIICTEEQYLEYLLGEEEDEDDPIDDPDRGEVEDYIAAEWL